jgi:rRNA maturation protein Nop10
MQIYDKFDPLNGPMEVPKMAMQIAEAKCYHCGKVTRFPVPPAFHNWAQVAERYRTSLQDAVRDFEQIGKDIEAMSGENPLGKYIWNRIALVIDEKLKGFDKH